jgi:hypothetical protein
MAFQASLISRTNPGAETSYPWTRGPAATSKPAPAYTAAIYRSMYSGIPEVCEIDAGRVLERQVICSLR